MSLHVGTAVAIIDTADANEDADDADIEEAASNA